MADQRKTKIQLLEELAPLRQQVLQGQTLDTERALLHQLAHDLVSAADTQAVADLLFKRMQGLFGSDHQEFMLVDAEGTALVGCAANGYIDSAEFRAERIPLTEPSLVTVAFQEKQVVIVSDFSHSPLVSERLRTHYPFIHSAWVAPLMIAERAVGVVCVSFSAVRTALPEELRLLQLLGDVAALAVDRTRLTEELHEEKNKLEAILNTTPDGIALLDLHGNFLTANEKIVRDSGLSLAQLRQRSFRFFFTPAEQEGLEGVFAQLCGGKGIKGLEICGSSPLTGYTDYELDANPLRDDQGEVVAVVACIRDIGARKQAEAERRQLQAHFFQMQKMEALGTLARGVAHDFNNILSAIVGFTELVTDDVPAGTQARMYLEEVLKASHRAKELIRQIVMFSRSGTSERALIDLRPVIADTVALLRLSLAKTTTLTTDIDETIGRIWVDPTQMQQLLMNLLLNAAQAIEEAGGTITVSLRHVSETTESASGPGSPGPAAYAHLSVRDSGRGIGQDMQARIFEPFFTTRPVGEGYGLGLAVVHGIVSGHGGTIRVESAVGRGSTFHVYLPITESPITVQPTAGWSAGGSGGAAP